MGDADFDCDFGDCDCGDCDCGDCDCGDCDCGDCDCDCGDGDCGCHNCVCDIDDCCSGCICDFDKCGNCQACCGNNGNERCGRECASNDFDCCRCSYCDIMCCVFYDDIYYYGYYGNSRPYYGYGGDAHGRQQNTNQPHDQRNQQRHAYADSKPSPPPSSSHNKHKKLWFRRFVKCLLPCGKPFWKIMFILLPLYILFSPILVPVLLIYTCIRGCKYCMGLEPDRNAMNSHGNVMNLDPEIGPSSQTMDRGRPGDYWEEQRGNANMTHPTPPYQGAQSSVIVGSHGTYTAEEVGPQMTNALNPDPFVLPVPNKDQQVPDIGTENAPEPNVDPPPYPGLGPEELARCAEPAKTVNHDK